MWNKLLPAALRGRIVLQLTLALLVGIILYWFWYSRSMSFNLGLCSAIIVVIVFLLLLRSRFRSWAALLPLGLLLGILLCAGQLAALDSWPAAAGDEVEISGRVLQLRETSSAYQLRIAVEQFNGEELHCSDVLVYSRQKAAPGSRVVVRGDCIRVQEYNNEGAFHYSDYLRQQGIGGIVSTYFSEDGGIDVVQPGWAFSLSSIGLFAREHFISAASTLPSEQAALLQGIFLGNSSDINDDTYTHLRLSGLLHVFALSGLHVGYVAKLGSLLGGSGFRYRYRRLLFTVLFLLLYLAIAGPTASLLRAVLLLTLGILAQCLMEKNDPVTSLALAALVCLLFRPLWLFSAGFQLSFAAAWAILILAPAFQRRLPQTALCRALSVSVAAALATMPLLAYYFGTVSWIGCLLSPLVVVAAGAAVMLCFVAALVALFSPLAAGFILKPAGMIMQLMSDVADWSAQLPGSYSELAAVSLAAVLIFFVLLLFLPALVNRCKLWKSAFCVLLAVGLFVLSPRYCGSTGLRGSQLNEAVAEVVFLDVGQGDCTLILTADGYSILIDGGGKPNSPGDIGKYVLLPYLRQRGLQQIDVVINSHPDADHCDGILSVLDSMDVAYFLYADCFDNDLQHQLLAAARDNGSALIAAGAGCTYRLGENLLLRFYSPPLDGRVVAEKEENDSSLIVEISCGEVDFLFTGDATAAVLEQVAEQYDIEAEILKVAHHGSRSSYSEAFYRYIEAQLAVVSVGAGNSYGHPASSVVEYWEKNGELFRTDMDGAVTVFTDGINWQIKTEKTR